MEKIRHEEFPRKKTNSTQLKPKAPIETKKENEKKLSKTTPKTNRGSHNPESDLQISNPLNVQEQISNIDRN